MTSYAFKKDGTIIANVTLPDDQYSLSPASVTDNAVYTCCAFIDDVSSDESSNVSVSGGVNLFLIRRKPGGLRKGYIVYIGGGELSSSPTFRN